MHCDEIGEQRFVLRALCALQRRTNKTKPTAHFVRQKLIGYLRAVESF